MPARKPAGLRNRAETKAETAARIANEAALEPERGLSVQAPARLKDHPVAQAAWRRLMRMYGELQATVVTRMDQDLLVDYCMLMEQVVERDNARAALKRVRRNKGSPGIDGMSVEELPRYLVEHWHELREQLLAGTYWAKH